MRIHQRTTMAVTAAAVFVFTWFFRFNDPNGGATGLTDDHFFYLIRGWQILFGELPVRDFVDHGAPLYFCVSAAVQFLFGRGMLSELAFSTTMIALGAALTCWLSARAAGSIAAGLIGAVFAILINPRFYNYPKILVYAAAIPLLWWYLDRPGRRPLVWLAVITVAGFLFRHDHGVFVALAAAAALLLAEVPWRRRVRHAFLYAALVVALATPYLAFLQLNGGVKEYITQASAWADRERARTPVVWPGLLDNPDGASNEATNGSPLHRAVAIVRDNRVAWLYYLEILLPFLALAVLAISSDAFRPGWPHATPKIAIVALLSLVLDAGFLRSPLSARLADPSVPHAILVAWLAMTLPRLLMSARSWRPAWLRWTTPARIALVLVSAPCLFVLWSVLSDQIYDKLDSAKLVNGPRQAIAQARNVSLSLQEAWDPSTWRAAASEAELFTLALYLNRCTPPSARVFVQSYIPQVLGLARRGFAAGHGDLRPGFYTTPEEQAMALRRLRQQDVPVVLLATDDSLANFRQDFPLLTEYFDTAYDVAGTHTFDDRIGITLLVRAGTSRVTTFEPLGWPCPAPQE
jgi:hypothetical protein